MPARSEAFSRVLIDQALRDSGWDLLDPQQVRFELHGAAGRADYVLGGPLGPLCVLEAKREDLDPYDAKEQARGYAENAQRAVHHLVQRPRALVLELRARRPADAYRIERLPSPARPGAPAAEESPAAAPAAKRSRQAGLSASHSSPT